MGVDGAHELVVEQSLIVVHITGIVRIEAVQIFGQLSQIVGTASLVERRFRIVGHRQHLRVGQSEHLAIAHATHGVAVAPLYGVPEIPCYPVVIRVGSRLIAFQGPRYHRYMLVGMTRTDGIDVAGQRVEEGGRVETGSRLYQAVALLLVCDHHRQSSQRLRHAPHLTGDVHVPHLVTVTRLILALSLRTVFLHIGTVVQAVPHPESHVAGNEQGFLADGLVVDDTGYVNQSGQLLMHGIVRSPHPVLVVIGTIHLDEHAVLRWDGVHVAIAIVTIILLIAVKVLPRAFHRTQFSLGSHVARLEIAAQRVAPHESALLTASHLGQHEADATQQRRLFLFVLTTGIGHGHSREIMPCAMSLEFCRR